MQLTIPQPCSQRLEEMPPTSRGGYCQSCHKIVIDFTLFTDAELIAFFQQHSSGVCGRLSENHLHIRKTAAKSTHSRLSISQYIVGVGLLLLMPAKKMQAAIMDTLPVQMPAFKSVLVQPIATIDKITGKITDQEGNSVKGAVIMVRGTTRGTVANAEGEFVLNIPDSLQKTYYSLEITAVGFEPQTIGVNSPVTKVQVKLDYIPEALLGEVVITGGIWVKKTWWQKVKDWFDHK